jgi:hypothetical protein
MHAEPDIRALLRDALTQIRSLRAELAEREQELRVPLAIVGASCRFPAGADNLDAFARGLRAGVDAVTTVPADRWNADSLYDPDPAAPAKIVSREGAFLAGIDQFDPEFFGIAPREAEQLDPNSGFYSRLHGKRWRMRHLPLSVCGAARPACLSVSCRPTTSYGPCAKTGMPALTPIQARAAP